MNQQFFLTMTKDVFLEYKIDLLSLILISETHICNNNSFPLWSSRLNDINIIKY